MTELGRGLPRRASASFRRASGSEAAARAFGRESSDRSSRSYRTNSSREPALSGSTLSTFRHLVTVWGVMPHQWQTA